MDPSGEPNFEGLRAMPEVVGAKGRDPHGRGVTGSSRRKKTDPDSVRETGKTCKRRKKRSLRVDDSSAVEVHDESAVIMDVVCSITEDEMSTSREVEGEEVHEDVIGSKMEVEGEMSPRREVEGEEVHDDVIASTMEVDDEMGTRREIEGEEGHEDNEKEVELEKVHEDNEKEVELEKVHEDNEKEVELEKVHEDNEKEVELEKVHEEEEEEEVHEDNEKEVELEKVHEEEEEEEVHEDNEKEVELEKVHEEEEEEEVHEDNEKEVELEKVHEEEEEEEEEEVEHPIVVVDPSERRIKQREDKVRHCRVPVYPSRRRRKWGVLNEACPGGPTDPTVLSSYTGHILYAISESASNDRDTLDHYSQTKRVRTMLLEGWPLECGSEMSKWVDKSQLMQLTSCMFEQYDMPLISAFLDRWRPDTNTFHLPFGEMSILLHDVQYILGLKIDGKAVHTENVMSVEELSVFLDVKDGFDVVERPYLWKGKDLGAVLDKGDILPQALMDKRKSKTVVDQCVAYLTLLTGFTLFTGKRRNRIPYEHMKLLFDLDEVEEYSWGSATLAWLYREMGKATRSKTKGISACLTLLQAWIYMYFPIFRPSPRGQPVQVGEPYSLMFKNNVKHDTKKDSYNAYRQRIDQLTSALVMWQPYNTGCVIPEMSRYSGVLWFMDVVEAYHPERCLRQFGYVQHIPAWPLHQPISAVRSWYIQAYKVDHAASVSSWEMRHSSLLNLERLSVRVEHKNDPDVVRGYHAWYQKISHPIFYYGDIPDNVANYDFIGYTQMADQLKDLVMNAYTQPTEEETIQMLLDYKETAMGLATRMSKVRLTSRGYLTRRD